MIINFWLRCGNDIGLLLKKEEREREKPCLSKINAEIFTDEVLWCLVFASNKWEVGGEIDKIRLAVSWKLLKLVDGYIGVHYTLLFLYIFEVFLI